MRTPRPLLMFLTAAALGGVGAGAAEILPVWRDANRNGVMDPYEDPTRSAEDRVADLLSRMTVAEKLGQLNQRLMASDAFERWNDDVARGEVGAMLPDAPVVNDARLRNQMQRTACEESAHGIPLLLGFDTIHGFRTVFPIPLAQACAWDEALLERTSTVAARETTAAGIDWIFAPMCDVARDPRWGRIAEGFGEDPLLVSRLVAASVRGFQGERADDPERAIACLKHFVGYGAAEGGRDYNTVEITDRTMRDVYLPPFRAGVHAGARSLMCAFHTNNGVPAAADGALINGVLRGEWGFDGFVVSDWTAVSELKNHGFANDAAECARLAINAGVDMEMVSETYRDTLPVQIQDGLVSRKVLDAAVSRVLRVKFERGLFDRPYKDESRAATAYLRPGAVAMAREAAARSCVLLKNRGALPLAVSQIKKLALIGPLADSKDEMLGTWQGQGRAEDVVTLAEGLREHFGQDRLAVARGCPLVDTSITHTRTDGTVVVDGPAEKAQRREIDAAVMLARTADVVVMALGEPRGWSGENASRTALEITGAQRELFEAVSATGKPVVVVLFGGRPLVTPVVHERAAAVLMAWHPGIQAGPGLADVLTGAVEPTGRLAVTWPRSVGQIPLYYNKPTTGRPRFRDYKDSVATPLYPFGFGLGYARVECGETRVAASAVPASGTVVARAVLTNRDARPTTQLAQFYVRAMADANGVRPVRELREYRHVKLAPGESREVVFEVPAAKFARLGAVGGRAATPEGRYRVWVATDAASGVHAEVLIERK